MTDADRKPVPRALELAWAEPTPVKPGPKPTIDLADIVAEAIRLADRDGLAGVSLAKVASALGCATTALYRYIRSKSDLVLLMRDHAIAPPEQPQEAAGGDWCDRLRGIAARLFEAVCAHPWTLDVPAAAPASTPNELMWGEHILRALVDTSLRPVERLRVVTLVTGYVREQARLARSVQDSGDENYPLILRRFLTIERFPAFTEAVASGALAGPPEYTMDDFYFGLDRILDGVAELNRTG